MEVVNRVVDRGAIESAHRILSYCKQIYRYAILIRLTENNPTRDLQEVIPIAKKKHLAFVTKPDEVAKVLNILDKYEGSFIVNSALSLAKTLTYQKMSRVTRGLTRKGRVFYLYTELKSHKVPHFYMFKKH